ncbi:cytochrome c peroxidase [Mesorhizobium sp. VK24D]|uniref:Cytochrome c peroxidase n=1 Tax=Mesorhizobium album TaxID=3072314 RepID=A0ABU4Y2G0_9HYPH|nr:cytochrome c peroxidase [Mesorhizobium sp. VK24D]MDX8480097.1 cytochrome c peroxidase [Mesorhizobium sp. VK24D]
MQLKGIPGYVDAFDNAFPADSDPVTYDNIEQAIAVFEAALITPNAPFDRYLEGDENVLTVEQKEGRCVPESAHRRPAAGHISELAPKHRHDSRRWHVCSVWRG